MPKLRAMPAPPYWGMILSRTGLLIAFGAVMAIFATRPFRSCQRTL